MKSKSNINLSRIDEVNLCPDGRPQAATVVSARVIKRSGTPPPLELAIRQKREETDIDSATDRQKLASIPNITNSDTAECLYSLLE